MFFNDFFGMDPDPSSYSSWPPRMDQQFPAQCYSDYSPYYGYASPVSSRRPRTKSYYPFQSPLQTEVPLHRESPMDTRAASKQRPIMNDGRTTTEQDFASGCSGCSECGFKNRNRRSRVKPGVGEVRANNEFCLNEEDSESSSEEEETRFSPPLSNRQTLKKSKFGKRRTQNADNDRRSDCDKATSPADQKLHCSPTAKCEREKMSENNNGDQPISEKKSAESEDTERPIAEVIPECAIPVQNVRKVKTSTEILSDIQGETESLEARIKAFSGTIKDRDYIVIDELITKILLRLDTVESGGDEDIRTARRSLVRHVQTLLVQLEQKVGFVRSMEEAQQESTLGGVNSPTELQEETMADETDEQETGEKSIPPDEDNDSSMET